MIVECVIGRDGVLREPRIVDSAGETTLVYIVLDSLREWQFEPAQLDGRPAASIYNVTARFKG